MGVEEEEAAGEGAEEEEEAEGEGVEPILLLNAVSE
jgi:hypothetical protein